MLFSNSAFEKKKNQKFKEPAYRLADLEAITSINYKTYLIKRTVESDFKENLCQFILFDNLSPKWNYLIKGKI
jgi:hypothetical protein